MTICRWVLLAAFLVSCGAGGDAGEGEGAISGQVFVSSAPLVGATVHGIMVNVDDGAQVFDLGRSAPTDAQGSFVLSGTGNANGLILLEVELGGSSYVEPATGETITSDPGVKLQGAIWDVSPGEVRQGVMIDPVTALGVALGKSRKAAGKGPTLLGEIQASYQHLGAHFGGIELGRVAPADLTAGPAPSATESYRYGAVLAGISELARSIAVASNVPTRSITSLSVTSSWISDLADGSALVFDGQGPTGPVTLGFCMPPVGCEATMTCQTDCDFSGDTPRVVLGKYMNNFLANLDRNKSGLDYPALMLAVTAIVKDDDAFLFAGRVVGDLDTEPPTIHVLPSDDALLAANPAAGAYVRGDVTVRAIIDDNFKTVGMGSLPVLEQTLHYTVSGVGNPTSYTDGSTHGLSALADGRVMLELLVKTVPANDGGLTITFMGQDRTGRTASAQVVVKADNTRPVVNPTTFDWAKERPTIRAAVIDASPLASVVATVDTSVPCTGSTAAMFSCVVATDLANGPHSVVVRATDAAGNVSDAGFPFAVDTVPPQVTLPPTGWQMDDESKMTVNFDETAKPSYVPSGKINVAEGATLAKYVTKLGPDDANPIRWLFQASDVGSGAQATAQYTIANGSASYGPFPVTVDGTTWTAVVTTAQVPGTALETQAGEWTVTLTVTDVAGNPGSRTVRWNHLPLGAPLEIKRDDEVAAGAAESLSVKSLSLADGGDGAVAGAINGAAPKALALYRVRNGTDKTVNLAVFVPTGSPSSVASASTVSGYQPAAPTGVCSLDDSGSNPCEIERTDYPYQGTSQNRSVSVRDVALYDGSLHPVQPVSGGATTCEGLPCYEFQIPSTTSSPTPEYWVAVRGNLDLWPSDKGTASLFSVAGMQVVGRQLSSYVACMSQVCHIECHCAAAKRFQPYDGLDQFSFTVTNIRAAVRTRPALSVPLSVFSKYASAEQGSPLNFASTSVSTP